MQISDNSVQPSTAQYSPIQPSTAQYSPVQEPAECRLEVAELFKESKTAQDGLPDII